ncbi:MAG: cyclase family protein [Actinobacteria bacterium]|nr:MAG: cyclase family protein [Actinomycetota bacterium]
MGDERYELIDLSHVVEHGMITYPGLPGPAISDYLSREDARPHYDDGTEFHIGMIEMVANTGTYVDSPFHRFSDGKDLSQLKLPSLAYLQGRVFRADPEERACGRELFGGEELRGKAVLIHTGWDIHWGNESYFHDHPYLTREAAEYLAEAGPALVGIDSLNIDDTSDGSRPAHTLLLGAEIPVVEHLCGLGGLPDSGFRFFAVPVKVRGLGTFPVRAFALVLLQQEKGGYA